MTDDNLTVEDLRGALREAIFLIEMLQSVQNGCPLATYQRDFDEANRRADAFIARFPAYANQECPEDWPSGSRLGKECD